ncbi:uncharacterized protein [Amphiura filiformis]|uniref:uncharacterized protein n=1 Tax=Amphiura filiformis TaxID=82378 RepID=UPI003B22424F
MSGQKTWRRSCYLRRIYPGLREYERSKLANVLFTKELARQLEGSGVTTYSLHPGAIQSSGIATMKEATQKSQPYWLPLLSLFNWLIASDERAGAQTTIYCALEESITHFSGRYFDNCRVSKESKLACDDGLAKKLWDVSCQATACQPINTPNDYKYQYLGPVPEGATSFTFSVRANNDVHIALSPIEGDAETMYEIVIGGWGNQKSSIRLCKQCENLDFPNTPAILSATEYRQFRVSFGDDLVEVFSDETSVMRFQNTGSIDVNYVGISTGWGSEGSFMFCGDWGFEPAIDCQPINTPNDYKYQYLGPVPEGATSFTFSVRANNDVHIALSPIEGDAETMYEIVIGGWGNQKSSIRLCKQCENLVFPNTPAILSATEYRQFRVSFGDDLVEVFSDETSVMSFQNTGSIDVNYVGISTGWGSEGSFKFCGDWDLEPETETAETCLEQTVESYGSRRVQNSDFQYPFPQLPPGTERITFKVTGHNDAYILLSPTNDGLANDREQDKGVIKIVIGGWNNQGSAVLCNSHQQWTRFDTPNVLSTTEAREFFVEFVPGTNLLLVGRVGQPAFISTPYCSEDVKPEDVKYVGIASGWGSSNTQWEFCSTQASAETCLKQDIESYGSRRVQNSDFQYPFPQLPPGTERITFKVTAPNDAYIILSPTNDGLPNDREQDKGVIKIVIGGWNNQGSAVLCNSHQQWTRFDTPNVLSTTEARDFFVEFVPGTNLLQVGRVGQDPFISTPYCSEDVKPEDVKYVGIASGWGSSNTQWEFCSTQGKST